MIAAKIGFKFIIFIAIVLVFTWTYLYYETFIDSGPYISKKERKIFQKVTPITKSFRQLLADFPFNETIQALKEGNEAIRDKNQALLIDLLVNFYMRDNLVPINASCQPSEIKVKCDKYPNVFDGPRKEPARMAHLIQFGFDIDVLEIALHQYKQVVDKVFLIESTRAHYRQSPKRLLWEELKHTPRFATFKDFVVHFIMDDAPGATFGQFNADIKKQPWFMEKTQEKLRWYKFVEWNEATKYFRDDDIIGFGDTDEIPSLENLMLLKNCQMKNLTSVDVGIWFPFGDVRNAFRPDWSVSANYSYSLGDPTYYTVSKAHAFLKSGFLPDRRRGGSGNFLIGGMHMSHDTYLISQLLKRSTATETGVGIEFFERLRDASQSQEALLKLETKLRETGFESRTIPVDKLDDKNKELIQYPWFYQCNPNRYPNWLSVHDKRLD